MRETTQLAKLFSDHTVSQLSTARVLVVGAGGIGCELLKNLAMSGFHTIHSIDLDHIDLSNLNRQFLFQRRHIKLSKSQVATGAITRFNPRVHASAEQANITNTQYDVDWFAQFDIVLNALDNLEARRHVNTMCLAARVPLVESGTAGYLGQVTVIKGMRTECFECQPKPVERKTYPVCTIRSTPTTPIHCIVWAKDYLFAQLFAEHPGDMDEQETAENADELRALREESRALAKLAGAMGTRDFARLVFEKVFDEDVARLLSMKDMWAQRRPPTVLDFSALNEQSGFDPEHPDDHAVLDPKDWCALFVHSAERLAQRRLAMDQSTQGGLVFDKDDDDTLHFVAATANLRSLAFGIEQKSIFAIKAMAGNIIPAIATTNAIVAGMMVMQAILVLSQRISECHTSYVTYGKRARCIIKEPLAEPNPRCPVCRRRYLTLRVRDCTQTTLGDVLDFTKGLGSDRDLQLGDDISVVEGTRMLYDPDFDDNLSKPLHELGLVSGKMVTLTSEDDDSIVPVILSIATAKSQDLLSIEGYESVPIFAPLPQLGPMDGVESDDEDDVVANDFVVDGSGAIVLEDDDDVSAVSSISEELSKRKLDEISVISQDAPKRRAVSDEESDDVVTLD
ncbi:E1 ubiquitin-activating protein uba2 [Coemansia sp. RSA 1822]|nr:E1 ubiquitin-activating protein uba2 [Coemansia sp. RSA 638]KAJ2565387.1 E1 ubiquitin-activating protein uba2 [Coemansia sp. RSA 1822]